MSYNAYLKYYNLKDTEENRENWLYNEWSHGRTYMHEGKFYSVETGKEVK